MFGWQIWTRFTLIFIWTTAPLFGIVFEIYVQNSVSIRWNYSSIKKSRHANHDEPLNNKKFHFLESKEVEIQKQPPEVFFKNSVFLKISPNLQENTCARVLPATFFEKRLWRRCFSVNFPKSLRTSYLLGTSGQALLEVGNDA